VVEEMLRRATNDAETLTCKAINGLATEAEGRIKDANDPVVQDIALSPQASRSSITRS
jgi:ferritin-like metal-binding protein YciE